jgi:NTE family protein
MSALPSFLNKLSTLKQIPIFAGLNWFELNRIIRRCEFVEFNKGELVCKQGDPADAFYALVSGRIYTYTLRPNGEKEEVDFILRGMHFGIISALTGECHSHSYEAINDSFVLKINKDDFAQLLKATPKLAVSLSQSLSQRIRSHVTRTKSTQESTIIAVYAPVKGSGSSTYAANLALSLQNETSKKVLLLSLSSDQNDQRIDMSDIVNDHDHIMQSVTKGVLPVDLLCVKFDPKNSAVLSKISQFVSAPANDYNYIVVDLPNEMDDVVMKTLIQSDVIHLVAMDREKDLEINRNIIDRLGSQLKESFHADRVQVIISGVEPEHHLTHEEIKDILNYDVFLILPHLTVEQFVVRNVLPHFDIVEVDPKSEYAQTIRRLARQISGVMVGLVLGGGAALGMAHIGIIRVLEREGIPIDMVVGSSMGALIGSIWSIGHNADELEKFGQEFEKKSGMLKVYDPIVPISGLVGGEGIRRWLKGKLENKTFLETKIPIRIVAYDLCHRKEIVIDDGTLIDAVRKSVAIPGVIRPIIEGDQMIIDGGVLNPLPTNVLVDMGVKKIIAVNVLQSPQEVSWAQDQEVQYLRDRAKIPFSKHPLKFIGFRIRRALSNMFMPNIADIVVRTLQATEYVIAEESGKKADVLIHPDLKGINWFELYRVNELIQRGEEAAIKALPAIKALIKK